MMMRQLGPGDKFPEYQITVVGERSLQLPTDLKGDYAVILFYRGIW
jgi:peroxiredoxin